MTQVIARVWSVPSWPRWTLACAAGETVGMAAAAVAAGVAFTSVGEPTDVGSAAVVLALATLGGAVEGAAIGWFQWSALHPWLPRLQRRRWVGVTVAVAVAGWFLGMLPSTLVSMSLDPASAPDAAAAEPSTWVMPLLGIASGLVAGAIFGWAQAWAFRGHVLRPRVWIVANAGGWAAAMAIIFTGATLPPAGSSVTALLVLGAVTGVLAGLAIGGFTGLFLGGLDDPAPRGSTRVNRFVLGVLRSPARWVLPSGIGDLRYTGRISGHRYALPVQCAAWGDRLVVYPGHPERKVWWRNLRQPTPIEVGWLGAVRPGVARVLAAPDPERAAAADAYELRFRRVHVPPGAVLVEIQLT